MAQHFTLRVFEVGNRGLQAGACVLDGGYPAAQFSFIHLPAFLGSGNRKGGRHVR